MERPLAPVADTRASSVRPDCVVMSPPSLDQDPGLGERVEDLAIEQFIAQRPVEALAVSILPWRSGGDVERLHADLRQPFLHRRRDKFWALSDRICAGGPRVTNSSASAASTSSLFSLRATGNAMHSRLASSMIDRMRYLRPSWVRPSTKS